MLCVVTVLFHSPMAFQNATGTTIQNSAFNDDGINQVNHIAQIVQISNGGNN